MLTKRTTLFLIPLVLVVLGTLGARWAAPPHNDIKRRTAPKKKSGLLLPAEVQRRSGVQSEARDEVEQVRVDGNPVTEVVLGEAGASGEPQPFPVPLAEEGFDFETTLVETPPCFFGPELKRALPGVPDPRTQLHGGHQPA